MTLDSSVRSVGRRGTAATCGGAARYPTQAFAPAVGHPRLLLEGGARISLVHVTLKFASVLEPPAAMRHPRPGDLARPGASR